MADVVWIGPVYMHWRLLGGRQELNNRETQREARCEDGAPLKTINSQIRISCICTIYSYGRAYNCRNPYEELY